MLKIKQKTPKSAMVKTHGRFEIKNTFDDLTFDENVKILNFSKNDCPLENRVRQFKMTDRTIQWRCQKNKDEYRTKNGKRCCKTITKEYPPRMKKSTLKTPRRLIREKQREVHNV